MTNLNHLRVPNRVLRALTRKDSRRLVKHHDQVKLTYGDILCEPGKKLKHVYFPNSGIISLLTPVGGHSNVEVGLVGREGMAGMALFLGVGISPVRMLVQASGTALRIQAGAFRRELLRTSALHDALNLYLYDFMAQISQTAGCNRFHHIGARLARWLLMTHDRVGSDDFLLTHGFLAQMLGTRRSGVTLAARELMKKKLIRYSRGKITILDRKGLERASCACYRAVNDLGKHVAVRSRVH